MSTITFDTLKFVQRLERAGVSREHATAEAEALVEVFDSAGQDIAAKADLSSAKSELKADIALVRSDMSELRTELRAKMRSLELRLTIKLGAFLLASVGATVALLRAFP